ncbi:MAG: hypothetical protein IBX41_01570 [Methanophagales archaeon]|nr:hypothetical protein [Methanophagales archaeon]
MNEIIKNKSKIFGLSFLLIFSLLIFSNIGMACFNPTDSFATGVALNKPSITYDLSGIKQSKDVTVIEKEKEGSPDDVVEEVHREEVIPKPIEVITIEEEGEEKPKRTEPSFEDYIETNAIIYRSHYNKDIAVALMEEEWEGQKYLNVKIQVPTKFVKSSYPEIKIDLDGLPPITQEVNQDYLESLGYQVEGKFQAGYLKSQVIKENIDIAVWSISDIEEEGDGDEEGEKGKSFAGFSIRVRNQSTLTPELGEEFKNVLEAYGLSPDFLNQAKIKTETREDVDLEPAIDIDLDTFDWGLALRTELEWLRNNKVICGLTDNDLHGIAKVADKGTAGWNSKIRYFKGEWVQGITEEMSEETGMYMVRAGIDCGGFPIGLLPDEVPSGVPVPYNQLPFGVTVAYHEKALIVGVIIIIALIVGIVGFVLKK